MWHTKALQFALGAAVVAAFALSTQPSYAQQPYGPNDAPNLYKFNYGWAKLPDRRKFGAVVGVDIDRDGKSVWAFDRCESATDCSKQSSWPTESATGRYGQRCFSIFWPRPCWRAFGSFGNSGGCGCISSRYSMIASDCVSTSPESRANAGTRICGLIARYCGFLLRPPSFCRWIGIISLLRPFRLSAMRTR